MKSLADPKTLKATLNQARLENKTIGFVPTMGYFHEGHLELMRTAKRETDVVVTSLYVNPTQFGPNEDLEAYPRNLERDAKMAEEAGTDILFFPDDKTMYPGRSFTKVRVSEISDKLCGIDRPVHFGGVALVVTKLFNLVRPDKAYFGQKDFQQCKVVENLSRDLLFDIDIRIVPTYREPDGLAMSSRNVYLKPEEREDALSLSRAIADARELTSRGFINVEELRKRLISKHFDKPGIRLQYLEIIDPETLEPLTELKEQAVIAIAARVGNARLIDNDYLPFEKNKGE